MNDERIVTVLARSTYGLWRYYPQGDNAALFTKLTGTQTLTVDHLKVIRDLGYKIVKLVDNHLEAEV
jgi:hypothetical protein